MLRTILFPLSFALLVSNCTSQTAPQHQRGYPRGTGSGVSGLPSLPALPREASQAIGQRVWKNECAGTVKGLVSWNTGEDFPSLGIAHFIWFPSGVNAPFQESWPDFVRFAEARGRTVPSFLRGYAPWPNRSAYLADRSGLADQMRRWLSQNIDVQTDYLVKRSREALPKMMRASSQPQEVAARYNALARTTQGNYCLIDYVNFKGEGLSPTEAYNGQHWGLLQVLESMNGRPQGRDATAEFSRAAAAVLTRRVRNAPPARGESRWLPGWLNRCATYR